MSALSSSRYVMFSPSCFSRQMGRLCCNCLNVTVHHSSRAEAERRVPAARLLPEGCKDRIVDKELAEIELDVAGVTIVSAWAADLLCVEYVVVVAM